MKKSLLFLVCYLWVLGFSVDAQALVKNITPNYNPTISSFAQLGSDIYFTADDGIHGSELWSTDGTEAGTSMVIDLYPGTAGGCQLLTRLGNYIYFNGNDSLHGLELWKTDGTLLGTEIVKDIYPGSKSGLFLNRQIYTNGVKLFFMADDSIHGTEVWSSDGTGVGTHLIKDIYPGGNPGSSYEFFADGDTIYFGGQDGQHGTELWKTDGTDSGTTMVKDITPGSYGSSPYDFIKLNNEIFFFANGGSLGIELWATDGTDTGTHLVNDIWPGWQSGVSIGTGTPLIFNQRIFFDANDGSHGVELWSSDGTANGTSMVKDIYDGFNDSRPFGLTALNNAFFFMANDGFHGSEIWSSDGTEQGTNLLLDIDPSNSLLYCPPAMMAANGMLFFDTKDVGLSCRLWVTNGSAIGTNSLCIDTCPLNPHNLFLSGNTLYFTATSFGNSNQLWKLDLTALSISVISNTTYTFTLSPNPATNNLNISIDESLVGAQLNIYNVTGSLVQSAQLQMPNSKFEIQNLPNGVYIAEIKTKEGSIMHRWVKM